MDRGASRATVHGVTKSQTQQPILDISEDLHAVRYLSYLFLNPVSVELS